MFLLMKPLITPREAFNFYRRGTHACSIVPSVYWGRWSCPGREHYFFSAVSTWAGKA